MSYEPVIDVYMKKDIESDYLWERNPRIATAIYFSIMMALFFGGMVVFDFVHCPGWLRLIYFIGVVVADIVIITYRNEMCNISKSIAFVKRDQDIYMIKLGYLTPANPINTEVSGTKVAYNASIAPIIQRQEMIVRDRRQKEETYVCALDEWLQSGKLPNGVIQLIHLVDARIEKKSEGFIWISYQTQNGRKKKMFRNAYDIRI